MKTDDEYGMIAGHWVHKEVYEHCDQVIQNMTKRYEAANSKAEAYQALFWLVLAIIFVCKLVDMTAH